MRGNLPHASQPPMPMPMPPQNRQPGAPQPALMQNITPEQMMLLNRMQ